MLCIGATSIFVQGNVVILVVGKRDIMGRYGTAKWTLRKPNKVEMRPVHICECDDEEGKM